MIWIVFILIGIISITISFFIKFKPIEMDIPKNEDEENSDEDDINMLTGGMRAAMRNVGIIAVAVGIIIKLFN
ncbi:MAG: hypothetical protein IJ736_12970 [Firmicutes bacterium]|nr:hypothetical protein [Bacillota bacterium]